MEPRNAVCLLVHRPENQTEPAFLGTCFSFRSNNRFLTAAHCVGGEDTEAPDVYSPITGENLKVVNIERHPEADVAVLTTERSLRHDIDPFPDHTSRYEIGESFNVFGFPEDVLGANRKTPVARLFKGHFQRFFNHESGMGFRYAAGELNIACPGGLSGGPVYRANDLIYRVDGVVAEDFKSRGRLDSVEEKEHDGKTTRDSYWEVINYGVCVMLVDIRDWLKKHAPAPTP